MLKRVKRYNYKRDRMEPNSVPVNTDTIIVKTVEVEPVDEGVRVKPKRQLTETQLAILQKGREKLAEKRKAAKEQKEAEAAEKQKEVSQAEVAAGSVDVIDVIEAADQNVIESVEEEENIVPLCTII
jgi:hypothetical protein